MDIYLHPEFASVFLPALLIVEVLITLYCSAHAVKTIRLLVFLACLPLVFIGFVAHPYTLSQAYALIQFPRQFMDAYFNTLMLLGVLMAFLCLALTVKATRKKHRDAVVWAGIASTVWIGWTLVLWKVGEWMFFSYCRG